MFVVNDDMSIYVTRGDFVVLDVTAEKDGESYIFQQGDLVRIKVFVKKDCETVVLEKDFPVAIATETVEIYLDENDTKIGGVISKPVDYWYEIELNPLSEPQTIIGYDDDGAKVFRLFPEGKDLTEDEPVIEPEDIPIVDKALDLTSQRPVQNQAITRAIEQLKGAITVNGAKIDELKTAAISDKAALKQEIAVERARIDNLVSLEEASNTEDEELIDIRVGADGVTYASAGSAVRSQFDAVNKALDYDVVWINGGVVSVSSDEICKVYANANYSYTDFVRVGMCGIYYKCKIGAAAHIVLFDRNKRVIDIIKGGTEATVVEGTITNCSFVRFTNHNTFAPVIKSYSSGQLVLTDNSIAGNKIAFGSIDRSKTSFIEHIEGTNYIDKTALTKNALVDGSERYRGALRTVDGFYATELIKLEQGVPYYFANMFVKYYAFYDADGVFVSGAGNADEDVSLVSPFTIPENAAYGRFTFINETQRENGWINTEHRKPPVCEYKIPFYAKGEHESQISPCDYNGNDMCIFKKGLCIGDSLTEGTFNHTVNGSIANYVTYPEYSYPKYLQKLSGVEIVNKGMGGLTSNRWWANRKNDDMSGYDFAIIQLGVNDAIYNEGWTDESDTAFRNIINKLKAENTNIKIFVSTIIPATSYTGDHMESVSNGIRQLVTALNDNNVILLDMAIYGHTAEEEAYNNGHLSAYGYYRLAQDYKNYITKGINI